MNSTYTNNEEAGTLTWEKINQAIVLLKKQKPIPVFIFSQHIPYGEIYHGEMVDQMMTKIDPTFNSKYHKAYLVSEYYREVLNTK